MEEKKYNQTRKPEPLPENPENIRGYRPNVGKLNPEPPKGGSGVPPAKSAGNGK